MQQANGNQNGYTALILQWDRNGIPGSLKTLWAIGVQDLAGLGEVVSLVADEHDRQERVVSKVEERENESLRVSEGDLLVERVLCHLDKLGVRNIGKKGET